MGDKKITHPKDIEYFSMYPAPIFEHLHKLHYTNMNATIAFLGPMMYFLLRALESVKVLEIGHAEGYTAHYLAHAVKDTATRFGYSDAMYYGIDIAQGDKVRADLNNEGLPNTIISLDSANLTPDTFKDITFDVIFQDGAHDTKHVLHEMKTMYPQLRGDGKGYWLFHDCFGPAEEGFRAVKELIDYGIYNFEYIKLDCLYGLAIMRKVDGYDQNRKHWSD